MGKGFKHGSGGGASLNFKVVGGTAEPSNPKENTIWVNTETDITSWLFDNLPGTIVESVGTALCTINGRTFQKTTDGKAAFAMVYNGTHSGPMLVSPSIEACSYSTNDGFIGTQNSPGSIQYNGVTYYYHAAYWFDGNNTVGYPYVIKASNNKEAALRLAELYEYSNEGAVRISFGTSGEIRFDALKKNGIMVYPVSTQQYVGSSWVDVTAKSYQGGAWVDWVVYVYLYNVGDECTDITGGWVGKAMKASSSAEASAVTPTITRNSDHIFVKLSATEKSGVFWTTNLVDLTKYKKITVEGEFYAANTNFAFAIWSSNSGTYYDSNTAAETVFPSKTVTTSLSVDVSALSGNFCVGFKMNTNYDDSNQSYIKLVKCYME